MGDQQAAAGMRTFPEHQSRINYGTGAFWFYSLGQKPAFLPGLLTSVAADGNYFLEGPVNAAASALLWLNAQGITFTASDTDRWCQQAKRPVRFLPALGGLGAPYWNFSVTPVVENLSPLTRQPDWIAGTVQAIAYLLADIALYLQQNGFSVPGPVLVSGGLSRISYLTQFQADILQQELQVSEEADATILGAARLAFGQPDLWAAGRANTGAYLVKPRMPADEARALYAQWQQFVQRHLS